MKIFGSADMMNLEIPTGSKSKKQMVYGAWVGMANFYRAVIEHGTFDEYHFFADTKMYADLLRKNISRLNANRNKIKIIGLNKLPSYLENTRYTVFFTCGPDLSLSACLRNKYANPPLFPLCGIAFQTISYPELLKKDFFYNALGDLYPFDSIICTSSAAYKAIKNLNTVVSSSWQKERGLHIRYKGRLDSLPLGIEADDYGRIAKSEARRKLGLAEDKIIILYFGRLSLYDKADLYPLLLALKEISAKKENVLLLVAGIDAQGDYGVKLKKMAKEMGLLPYVKFILHNCLKEKYALYSASDIFVSPGDSVQESFGITLLEAMASGLPVVASDWNGYKDLIAHNKTGFRIPAYWSDCKIGELNYIEALFNLWPREHLYLAQTVCVDVKKLTEYLSVLIHSRRLRLEFGQNARNKIKEEYDWNALLPRYENLWLRLSELAKDYRIAKKQKTLFMPKYLRCFRHYATKILDGKTKIAISRGGFLFLKEKKLPFGMPEELQHIIAIKIIFMILIFLSEKEGAAISAVEGNIKSILKVRPHVARFHIMWMLKKDLLKLQKR